MDLVVYRTPEAGAQVRILPEVQPYAPTILRRLAPSPRFGQGDGSSEQNALSHGWPPPLAFRAALGKQSTVPGLAGLTRAAATGGIDSTISLPGLPGLPGRVHAAHSRGDSHRGRADRQRGGGRRDGWRGPTAEGSSTRR